MVSRQAIFRLFKNLIVTFAYWTFKGFCCQRKTDIEKIEHETSWFFIAATVIWLSPKEPAPNSGDSCDWFRHLYQVIAVTAFAHAAFCYVWIEFLTLLSFILCFFDELFQNAGLGYVMDNRIYTLKPEGGYINLFALLAFVLLILSIVNWLNMNDCEYAMREQSCSEACRASPCGGSAGNKCYFDSNCMNDFELDSTVSNSSNSACS